MIAIGKFYFPPVTLEQGQGSRYSTAHEFSVMHLNSLVLHVIAGRIALRRLELLFYSAAVATSPKSLGSAEQRVVNHSDETALRHVLRKTTLECNVCANACRAL